MCVVFVCLWLSTLCVLSAVFCSVHYLNDGAARVILCSLFILCSRQWFFECIDRFNSTTTTIISTAMIVRGDRFFREWKEKMDFGQCVRGRQT